MCNEDGTCKRRSNPTPPADPTPTPTADPGTPPANPTPSADPVPGPPSDPCRDDPVPAPPTNPVPTPADPTPAPPSSAPSPPPTTPVDPPTAEPTPTEAPPTNPDPPMSDKAGACVAEHNKERSAVGVPGVKWSAELEKTSQQWADTIKDESGLRHSSGEFPGIGENLAKFGGSKPTWERFQELWINEKQYFKNGKFPDVSTTGKWSDVGHYTAMIWRDVTEIGCAAAEGSDGWVFCCHYKPHPNMMGSPVY